MARCTLIFEDALSHDGKASVTLEGDLGAKDAKVTHATLIAMAVHKMFQTGWLGNNLQNIIPEMFVNPEEEEKKTT